MNKSRPFNFIKKHKVWSVVLAIVLLVLVLAYTLPLFVGDGTGKFSGIKKSVAERSLQYLYDVSGARQQIANKLSGSHDYIEDVIGLTPYEARQTCRLSPSDDAAGYYVVYISKVMLFGLRSEKQQQTPLATCDISKKLRDHTY